MIKAVDPRAEFSITDLAAEFGLTARALRFYEDKGLLHPRRKGQTRVYSAHDRARLNLILRGKRVGFSLNEIKEMLDLEKLAAGGSDALASATARFRERIAQLQTQRKDIDFAIADLSAGLEWMEMRLADREPDDDVKARAAAFEALARTWLYGGETPAAAE